MKIVFRERMLPLIVFAVCIFGTSVAYADTLSLTSGNNATTTPSVATSITGFQIVGNAASTTPVKVHVTNGTVHVATIGGVTMSGNDSATLTLSGTVANLNSALSTLSYTRGSIGTDTLEVALVNSDQIYWSGNGHVYEFATGQDWEGAKVAADAKLFGNVPGYLATITSDDENTFVYTRLAGDGWLAATDGNGVSDGLSHNYTTEDHWVWADGPEASQTSSAHPFFLQNSGGSGGATQSGWYSAWADGEPNDYNGDEDCGYMYASQSGRWNDYPCDTVQGYVIEYGTDGNLPTVVSKNVSITTADVPAVSSLFPATGATNATTTANLVITFTKTVSVASGNILIKKTSDDSLVESIDVTSGKVTGSGSGAITINPDAVLQEGVQYYVIIPSSALKDGSNNFFNGISATSTWTFTVGDVTAPNITSLSVTSVATTSASIIWITNEAASTKVVYSTGTSYASTTSETDTSSRVTSHSKTISGLSACTTYNYKAVSADAAANYATSSSAVFTTTGCPGGAIPSSSTSTPVTVSVAATSTVTDSGRTLTVATPANFTATSSSVVIQIKGLSSETVLESIGKPSGSLSSAASLVFDVTALIDNTTVLDSFDAPVTISYAYTDADISGLDESSLTMYHYHNGVWLALNNCSVNTDTNTITCNAPSFSTFAIFGTPTSNSSNTSGAGGSLPWCSGPSAPGWNSSLPNGGCGTVVSPTIASNGIALCPYYHFTRQLRFGDKGEDVRALQKFLNCAGYSLGADGPGSVGNETPNFSDRTLSSVKAYQQAYSADILSPIQTTIPTGIFAAYSQKKAYSLMVQ